MYTEYRNFVCYCKKVKISSFVLISAKILGFLLLLFHCLNPRHILWMTEGGLVCLDKTEIFSKSSSLLYKN